MLLVQTSGFCLQEFLTPRNRWTETRKKAVPTNAYSAPSKILHGFLEICLITADHQPDTAYSHLRRKTQLRDC